ncbi:MAG: ABC transporter ATP-binding protein [Planctomycetota bacterium]
MTSLAQFHGATRRYGERVALDALELEVRRGEVLGLVGPNGAGKTTALRLLIGQDAPDAGRVSIDGLDVGQEPLAARARLGYVPDGAPLYANLSPRQHLELVGRLHGLAESVLTPRLEALIAALDLTERIDDPVGTFSRGMRQKTAVACAVLPHPPLLVLDEPLTGLDIPTAALLREVLRGWAAEGGAVLYTSHLLDVVERVADRVAILFEGRLVALGSLAELRANAGEGTTLDEVFRALTRASDPARGAAELLAAVRGEPRDAG